MDALIHQLRDVVEFCRRAAWMQRFTAMRIGETMALRWERVDLESGLLILDPEITKGGYGGRTLPIASALAEEMKRWSRPGPWVCGGEEPRYSSTNRPSRRFLNAWKRTGVREIAWRGQPTHALRKGVISGLHALGAHPDAVEVLAGHSLGLRGAYLDRRIAFDLAKVVNMIPAVGAQSGRDSTPSVVANSCQRV
ncbi:MAG: tyrosine-type recombinase/integrase [Alphaproteobacteria bacterium]|nr:tyrosine-type recombinase/integrase [Alphaproteobacteria bacterium]